MKAAAIANALEEIQRAHQDAEIINIYLMMLRIQHALLVSQDQDKFLALTDNVRNAQPTHTVMELLMISSLNVLLPHVT
jgi:hypothetical protein